MRGEKKKTSKTPSFRQSRDYGASGTVQSPSKSWRLPRLRTQLRRGRQRRPAISKSHFIATSEVERIDVYGWFYDAILMRRRVVVAALLLSCFVSQIVLAQEQPPLQADLRVRVDYNDRGLVSFRSVLEGGEAAVRGTVQNFPGGETSFIQLHFDYRTDADIALDELISQIVI